MEAYDMINFNDNMFFYPKIKINQRSYVYFTKQEIDYLHKMDTKSSFNHKRSHIIQTHYTGMRASFLQSEKTSLRYCN